MLRLLLNSRNTKKAKNIKLRFISNVLKRNEKNLSELERKLKIINRHTGLNARLKPKLMNVNGYQYIDYAIDTQTPYLKLKIYITEFGICQIVNDTIQKDPHSLIDFSLKINYLNGIPFITNNL